MYQNGMPIDEKSWSAYLTEDSALRSRRNKILCTLGMVLMPVGALIDYLYYPQLTVDFVLIRIFVVFILGLIFALHYTALGKKYIVYLSMLGPLILNLSFSAMIYFSDGVLSRYHTFLSLMILGGGILLPWKIKETIIISLATLAMYFTACLLHSLYIYPIEQWNTLYNNAYLIIISGIIASTSSFFNTKVRISDFELRRELDVRNKKLEEMDRLKSRFFANISHELRTPLTLILAPIQELLQSPSRYDDKITELLNTAHKNALRLLRLVNDLLEIIKLEEGKTKYDRESIEIEKFLGAMVDSMRHLAGTNEIKLTKNLYPGANIIIADSYLLERIFINLIGNAIKFTPEGGSIIVSNEIDGDKVIVKITDTGIGISEDDLPYIFDRFHQVVNYGTKHTQGTGLGLALVKELTEILQGNISVTSELGKGTTMQITFPVSKRLESFKRREVETDREEYLSTGTITGITHSGFIDESTRDFSKEEGPFGEGPLVLVVDDEPDMLNYLISTIEDKYRVIHAPDGEKGLNLAKEYKPDLMLLDLMLPKIDGLEVCKDLKQNEKTRGIKIMLLTARIDEGAKIEALNYGADDFLTKPFSKTEVQTRLRNLLQTADLEKDLRMQNKELESTLSELKQTQSLLIHSEKINALGKLTAGLLHEINNPLNYSLTALQFIKNEPVFKTDAILQETFQDIDDGMGRIKTIISDLQAFAHPTEADNHKTFLFRDALKNALRFTSGELGDIKVIQQLAPDDEVRGSQGNIVQVLINLLSNSSKAIKSAHDSRTGEILIKTEINKDRLYIRFRDNGTGISKDIVKYVFDPFFTSRDVGEGMGLGLSICHSIIESHGGKIKVTSEHNEWTEFCFDLALVSEHAVSDNYQ